MNLKKPTLEMAKSPDDLLQQLVDYYAALVELDKSRPPSKSPALKAITADTFATMRGYVGDAKGDAGPRAVIVTGGKTLRDGLEGVFAWDPTSTLADNGSTVINPSGASPGRWRRIVFGSANVSLAFSNITGTASQAQLPDVVIGVQNLTAGTTYTPTAGTKSIILELWGGGGAGGGCPVTGAATSAAGGGGGSGGYLRKRITGLGAGPFTVAIGAGGAGVSGAAGNAGTATTFNDGTTTYTANGGGGGPASAASGVIASVLGGARAAISTNGDVNGAGVPGAWGLVTNATTAISGSGGATSLGGAGQGTTAGLAAPQAAIANTGSGGGGNAAFNLAAQTGGAGAAGRIVVTEFA